MQCIQFGKINLPQQERWDTQQGRTIQVFSLRFPHFPCPLCSALYSQAETKVSVYSAVLYCTALYTSHELRQAAASSLPVAAYSQHSTAQSGEGDREGNTLNTGDQRDISADPSLDTGLSSDKMRGPAW